MFQPYMRGKQQRIFAEHKESHSCGGEAEMIVAIDFDGTCVTHEYPHVGQDIGAAQVIKKMVDRGDKIILFTMRSGTPLLDACAWFLRNGIELFGVNENPEQHTWTNSPKPYAHIYIDDAALGCPLMRPVVTGRSFVDWARVATMMGIDLAAEGTV
jgi:hypothetical protein